jgi:DNA-binding NarL/FixJ family response regulator
MLRTETHTAVIYGVTPVGVRVLREIAETNKIDVVGVASERGELMRLLGQQVPDICVLEVPSDTTETDLDLIRRVHDKSRKTELIAIGEREDPADITAVLTAGADVYIFQDAHPDDVALALRHAFTQPFHVAYGSFPSAPRPAAAAGKGDEDEIVLTRREREILRLATEGHSNSAIASMLWVTEQTVKFHLSNLYRKLKVSNRTEAGQWARDSGLVTTVSVGA